MDERTLTERVRAALGSRPTREVRMFGGLSFMVEERMVVAVGREEDLLVRVDPERSDELLARPGATQAEMGAGRSMGPGWVRVAPEALTTDDDLAFWLGVALDHHARARPAAR